MDAPGTAYEREADQIAGRIMRMPEPRLQRACHCGGGCADCKANGNRRKRLQTKRVDANAGAAASADPFVEAVIRAPGAPLGASERSYMESRFGHDFSRIRIHTGTAPDLAAKSVSARAFTVGNDIVFASGEYAPQTSSGRHLLAHELTHTLQQNGAPRTAPAGGDAAQESIEPGGPAVSGVVQRQDAPSGGAQRGASVSTGTLDRAFVAVRAAAPLVPGLTPLIASYDLIKGVVYLWNHRHELLQQLINAIDSRVQQVPALARQKLDELVGSAGTAAEAVSCVGSQMLLFLESLATNWRGVIESFVRDLVFVGLFERSIPAIITNIGGMIDDIFSGEFRAAIDRGVVIMTEVNAIAGVLYLWCALLMTLLGGAAGSEVPAAGNAAGAAAGLTLAQVINIALISSVVATETVRVARGIDEMNRNWTNLPLRDAGCRQVAEGVFSIALTLALFFLGPGIQRIARSIIQRAAVAIRAAVTEASQALQSVLRTAEGELATAGAGGARGAQFSGLQPTFEPVPGTSRAPRPVRPATPPARPARPAVPAERPATPTPSAAPQTGPATGVRPGVGVAPLTEDPGRRVDRCQDLFGLAPGSNARWHSQRPPIAGNLTLRSTAFRLDAGINPPVGQPTTGPSRLWARAMGNPADDAGHAIARRFGGTAIFNAPNGNIFPQNLSVNRGLMVVRDREAAELHGAGCDVCVHIGFNYAASTATRPTEVVHTIMARRPGASDFGPPAPAVLPNP